MNIANGGTTNWKNGGKSYYRHIGKIASFLKTTPTYLLTGNIENVGDLTEEGKDFIMTLLPFRGMIVTDGLFAPYGLIFGKSVRDAFKDVYMKAKKNKTVFTRL